MSSFRRRQETEETTEVNRRLKEIGYDPDSYTGGDDEVHVMLRHTMRLVLRGEKSLAHADRDLTDLQMYGEKQEKAILCYKVAVALLTLGNLLWIVYYLISHFA